MWMAVTVVLLGLVAAGSCTLAYGPCHDVKAVDFDTKTWPGIFFMNVMTSNEDVSCLWVNRTLNYADGNSTNQSKKNVIISEVFKRIESGVEVESTANGTYVDVGYYQFSKELTPGNTIAFEAYWLHYNLPDLDCHFVCSHDERLKDGRGAFWCESAHPDSLKKNACKIKKLAVENNFDINDLVVVDNCNCSNMPSTFPKSKCKKVSITEYFKKC